MNLHALWKIAFPIIASIRFYRYQRYLEKSQSFFPDEIKSLQQRRLRGLIKHAYENCPYYSKRFAELGLQPDDIQTVDDLVKLPILTREDVRANFEALIAKNVPKEKMFLSSTGGSTGEPLRFYKSRGEPWTGAAAYRAYKWYGYKMGDKVAYLWGAHSDLSAQQKLGNKIKNHLLRSIYLDAFNLSEKQMGDFAQRLIKFEPKAIIAYASAAYLFARYLKAKGIENIRPKVVITQAEKLFDHQRQLIEQVFSCEVFDFYGSREIGAMASECPQHAGYHISAENIVLELVKDGKHVSPGEVGKILVTDLTNYAMPFIRYENGDLGVPSDVKCSCGVNLPLMHSIEGRATDILVIDGKPIVTLSIVHNFKDFHVNQYQVIQNQDNKISVKIVKGDKYSDEHTELILEMMHKYLGDNVKVNLVFVDSIPIPESGKHRFIISKVPTEF